MAETQASRTAKQACVYATLAQDCATRWSTWVTMHCRARTRSSSAVTRSSDGERLRPIRAAIARPRTSRQLAYRQFLASHQEVTKEPAIAMRQTTMIKSLILIWFLFCAPITLAFHASPVVAQSMCGDCNNDQRITIAELIATINNLLNDDCGFWCYGNGICDASCVEYPATPIGNDMYLQCSTSMCFNSEEQVSRCINRFAAAKPSSCYEVSQ